MTREELENIAKLSVEEIIKKYQTSLNGLEEKEAQKRLKEFGLNNIEYLSRSFYHILQENLFNFFNLLLLVAFIISFIIEGSKIETIIIALFFLLSVIISIWQDWRSENLIRNLEKNIKFLIWVKRDKIWVQKEKKYLVPGDYIKLYAGDIIPADIFIVKSSDSFVDESTFTGESEPILKKEIFELKNSGFPLNIALNGTFLLNGYLEGIVIATGRQTFLGKIIKKTLVEKKQTASQKIMNLLAKDVTLIALILITVVFLLSWRSFNIEKLLIFLILTFVAVVPEFLPLITTLILSLKANKLAKKGVFLKRLSSIEDLGAVEIICTDKTGTITEGKLKLKNIFSSDIKNFTYFFSLPGILSSNLDPFEEAIQEKYPLEKIEAELIKEVPFNPITRKEEAIVKIGKETVKIIKGAPEIIIKEFLPKEVQEKEIQLWQNEDLFGERTLALGIEKDNNKIYLGFVSFEDPLKDGVRETFKLAQKLNISFKILTGDSEGVARKVASQVGILKKEEKIWLGDEIRQLKDEELEKIVLEFNVFARLLPEDKFRLINLLQKRKIVAFLGEGINDILAIKKANVSLVVENAPALSKEEADIVLKTKNLYAIVNAIKEGRETIENIEKYIRHTLIGNFGNLIALSFLSLFSDFLPLTPTQIILTNILTDFVMVGVVTDKVDEKEIKKLPQLNYFAKFLFLLMLGVIVAFSLIYIFLLYSFNPPLAQTSLFLTTTLIGILIVLSIRTKSFFFLSLPSLTFSLFLILSLILTGLVFIEPFKTFFNLSISTNSLKTIIAISVLTLIVVDLFKVFGYKFLTFNKKGKIF